MLRERANEAADRCCARERVAVANTSRTGCHAPRRPPRASRAGCCKRVGTPGGTPRCNVAGEPREQAAEPGGAAHHAEAAAGPRPRANSQGGPAQDAGDCAGRHDRTPAAMAKPRRGHGRTRRDRATTGARCRAKAGHRPSRGRASCAAAPWPGAGPRRAAGGRAAKPRRAEDGTGRVGASARRGRVGAATNHAGRARRRAEPRRTGPRHGRDVGSAGSREQREGEKGRGKEEGESEFTTEGRWRRGRMASGWVRTTTRRRGRESRALGGRGEEREKGGGGFWGG
jgi:hypothetical protein